MDIQEYYWYQELELELVYKILILLYIRFKKMNNLFVLLITILFTAASCKKDKEQLWLTIKNNTNFEIKCKLFGIDEVTNEPFTPTYILDTLNNEVEIWSSDNTDYDPVDLISSKFDSMIIIIKDTNDVIIKYQPTDPSIDYQGNPFMDRSVWDYEEFEKDFPTNFSANTHTIKNYIFIID